MTDPTPGVPVDSGAVLTAGEKGSIVLLYAAIGITTVVAFVILFLISSKYDTAATPGHQAIYFGALGIAAYVFGLRHGVDADHIAAIDNTTRKLMQEGKRPLTVGTWFSLGHSTIVVSLIVALVFATRFIKDQLPALQSAGSIVGTLVSGVFLCLIGLINVIIVVEIYRIFRGLKRGELDEKGLEEQLSRRGFMNRYFGKLFRLIETPRQIYPVGVLFGLGFDTASEIALIAITVGVGLTSSIPIYVVLVLPLLFTSGMVLVDTTDAITMRFAYGWAFLKPIRKIYYNLTVTIISVMVAFVIGGIELLAVLSQELGLSGGFWDTVAAVNFEEIGFVIVGLFVVTWAVSAAYYRYMRYDEISFAPSNPPTSQLS
jgi:high-affinity nickel-transport protein